MDEAEHPTAKPKTVAQLKKERLQQADEVGDQSMDLENATFSAKDLSAFSKLTDKSASQTYSQ